MDTAVTLFTPGSRLKEDARPIILPQQKAVRAGPARVSIFTDKFAPGNSQFISNALGFRQTQTNLKPYAANAAAEARQGYGIWHSIVFLNWRRAGAVHHAHITTHLPGAKQVY